MLLVGLTTVIFSFFLTLRQKKADRLEQLQLLGVIAVTGVTGVTGVTSDVNILFPVKYGLGCWILTNLRRVAANFIDTLTIRDKIRLGILLRGT